MVWSSATETKTELLTAPVSVCPPEDYILTQLRPRKRTAAWFTFCHYCIPLPLVIGLILLDILIGELTRYICNARLFTFLLRFFIQLLLFQGAGHKKTFQDYSPARDYLSSAHLHLQIESMNHSSTSCLHIDHSSPSPIMNGFELDPLGSHLFQDLTPSRTTSIFLICLSHLLGWHTGLFLKKKKKSVLMTFSARSTLTENEEWKYHLYIIEAVMINWSH